MDTAESALCTQFFVIVKVIVRDSDDRGFQRVEIVKGFSLAREAVAERCLDLRGDSVDADRTFQVDDAELEVFEERSDPVRLTGPSLAAGWSQSGGRQEISRNAEAANW